MAMGSYLSIITLNVNGLNAPTKRQRLAEWIQKQDPCICFLQEILLHLLESWFGGAEFSQLLLVCKAFDFSFIFE